MRVHNKTKTPKGIHTLKGVVRVNPGQVKDGIKLTDEQAERVRALGMEVSGNPLSPKEIAELQGQAEAKRPADDVRPVDNTDAVRLKADLAAEVKTSERLRKDNERLAGELKTAQERMAKLEGGDKKPATPKYSADQAEDKKWYIFDAQDEPISDAISKKDAEAFNAMTNEEKAEYVEGLDK